MLECSEQACCPARGQDYGFFKVSPVLTQKTSILATNGGRACLCNDLSKIVARATRTNHTCLFCQDVRPTKFGRTHLC